MINNKYPTIKPSLNLDFANTKSLDPRISFRRGTPGTYYDGVTHVKAEENLIYPSIPNSTDWTINDISCVENYSSDLDPEGGNTATLITTNSGTNNTPYIFAKKTENASNDKFTHSVFVKPVTHNYVQLSINSQGSVFANFDLSTDQGEVGNIGEGVTASINSFTNGWYRISMTYTSSGHVNGSLVRISLQGSTSDSSIDSWNPSGSESVLVWGAQSELSDSVTSYTATNGTPITKYQPKLMRAAADNARFDHDPITGESKGLLIEEQRTNLISYSEDFDDDYWTHPRADVYEHAIAPDGTRSATELVANVSASGGMSIYNLVNAWSLAAGSTTTHSCYFKKGNNNYAGIWVSDGAGSGANQYFDILNGTVESDATHGSVSFTIDDASIQDVGNGWFRCSLTITTDATSVRSQFAPSLPTGDGSNISCTIYETRGFLWGAQLETGSFPTSYIKTTGASATRSADNASIIGENFSSWYRQDEGSLYVETSTFDTRSGNSRITFSDGTNNNRIFTANGDYALFVQTNEGVKAEINSNLLINQYVKKAIGLKENDFAVSVNGVDPIIDSSGTLPLVDKVGFWNVNQSGTQINGHIKKLAYYPQRLTNEQLQNLTK